MPNVITAVTTKDQTRRGRVVLTGQFDGASGQELNVIKVNTWGLAGALSTAANGRQLLAGNGSPFASYNVNYTRIEYSVSGGGQVILAWQGSTNTAFAVLSGSGEISADRGAEYSVGPIGTPAPTGNIVLSTLGFGANTGYTVIIDYKKDPVVFNQGQIERPKDFNIILSGNNA